MDIDRLTSFVIVQHQALLHAQKSINMNIDGATQAWLADGMCAFVSQDHRIDPEVRLVALETAVGDLSSYYQRFSSVRLDQGQLSKLVDRFQEEWLAVFNGRWCRLQAFGVEEQKPHAFKLTAKVLQTLFECGHSERTDTDLEWNIQEALAQHLQSASVHEQFLLEHTIDELCSQLRNVRPEDVSAKEQVAALVRPEHIIGRYQNLLNFSKHIQPLVLNNDFKTLKIDGKNNAFKP